MSPFTNHGFDPETGGEKRAADITPPPDYNNLAAAATPDIFVIGSGDFGRALAGRLAQCGHRVTIASRDGGARNRCALELATKVIRMFSKISQSQRRPPREPSPGFTFKTL